MTSYDSPDNAEVLQEDETYDTTVTPIPVEVCGSVMTEELPSRIGSMRNVPILSTVAGVANTEATLIVPDNPRRKSVTLWSMPALDTEVVFVCVGMTRDEANEFTGVLIPPGGTVVIPGTYSGPLWGRACLVTDTTGAYTGITVATDDILLSVITEEWAR